MKVNCAAMMIDDDNDYIYMYVQAKKLGIRPATIHIKCKNFFGVSEKCKLIYRLGLKFERDKSNILLTENLL